MAENKTSVTDGRPGGEVVSVVKKILFGSLVIAFTGFVAFALLFVLMFFI